MRTIGMSIAAAAGVIAGSAMAGDRPLDLNVTVAVRDWRALLESGQVAKYLIIGDSISLINNTYNYRLRDLLESDFGNGGDGYLALNRRFAYEANGGVNRRPGLTFSTFGNWVVRSSEAGPRSALGRRAFDGIYSQIGWQGTIEATFFGPEATLHYIAEPGAGLVRVELNGAEIAQIDASTDDGSTPALATFTFPTGQSDPTIANTLRLSLVGATSQNPMDTQINGLFMTTGTPGPMQSRLSRGNAGPDDFLLCNPQIAHDTLAAIGPDLVIVMLDRNSADSPYREELGLLLDRIEAALPQAEVLLLSHHHFLEARSADTDDLIALAIERGHGFINLFDLHESQSELIELGLTVADGIHLSGAGGEWFARYIRDVMFGSRAAAALFTTTGFPVSGDVSETRAADDDRFVARSRRVSVIEPSVFQFEASFVTDALKATTLEIELECHATVSDAQSVFSLRDWSSGKYVTVGSSGVPWNADGVIRLDNLDAARFVNASTGAVDLRVRTGSFSTRTITGFLTHIDSLRIRAE